MKIILAVDGSPCSDAAVAEVCRRPWPESTQVRLVTVDSPLSSDVMRGKATSAFDEIVAQKREESVRLLSDAKATMFKLAPSLNVVPKLIEGVPKEAILDEADRWDADLIVVGSHGRGAIKRFLLGSVSMAVAANAPCSVEIVRIRTPVTERAVE